MNSKILVLIGGYDENGYDKMTQVVKETWAANPTDDFRTLFYFGYRQAYPRPEPGKTILVNQYELISGISPDLPNAIIRMVYCFRYVLEHYEFDYIFRTCNGSYIHKERMFEFIKDKPRELFYHGILGERDGIKYASGAGHFISKDLVERLSNNGKIDLNLRYDDVQLGDMMAKLGISIYKPEEAKRMEIGYAQGTFDQIMEQIKNDPANNFHYHFGKFPELILGTHKIFTDNNVK